MCEGVLYTTTADGSLRSLNLLFRASKSENRCLNSAPSRLSLSAFSARGNKR